MDLFDFVPSSFYIAFIICVIIVPAVQAWIVQLVHIFQVDTCCRFDLSATTILDRVKDFYRFNTLSFASIVTLCILALIDYKTDVFMETIVFILASTAYSLSNGITDSKLIDINIKSHVVSEYNVLSSYIDNLRFINSIWHNLQALTQLGIIIVATMGFGIHIAIMWASIHWLYHDMIVNNTLGQKWYFVGTTASIDKALRWLVKRWEKKNDSHLLIIGVGKIIIHATSLIYFIISII